MFRLMTLTLPLLLAAGFPAAADSLEDLAGSETLWVVAEIDGNTFEAPVSVSFGADGHIYGDAPCNSFTGSITGDASGFVVGPLAMTRMACPELDAETKFTTSFAKMTRAEMTENGLLLQGAKGHEMLFVEELSE